MFKKLLMTSAIFVVNSSVVFANGSPYVGASLGINTNTSTAGSNFRGIPVDIFAGYGSTVNTNLYLGGEVFATPTTITVTNTAVNSVKTTYSYGATFIPGIMLSDHSAAYVKIGAVRSHFSIQSQNVNGGQLGFGMQTSVNQNLDLRGEYVYTGYRSVNQTVAGTTTRISPKTDAFNLGLVYKFE
jgi:opacity protein-like surface antigen